MTRDTRDYIASCPVCARGKASHPWEFLDVCVHTSVVDFVTGLPPSEDHHVILTVVDRFSFSKSALFILLPKLLVAAETGELLVQHVFRFHGIPRDIVSNHGPQFFSQVWRAFCSALGALECVGGCGGRSPQHFCGPLIARNNRPIDTGCQPLPIRQVRRSGCPPRNSLSRSTKKEYPSCSPGV